MFRQLIAAGMTTLYLAIIFSPLAAFAMHSASVGVHRKAGHPTPAAAAKRDNNRLTPTKTMKMARPTAARKNRLKRKPLLPAAAPAATGNQPPCQASVHQRYCPFISQKISITLTLTPPFPPRLTA
jgi:hypothetical protein